MTAFTTETPGAVPWRIATALTQRKVSGQGWMTLYRRMKVGDGHAAPEDLRSGRHMRSPMPQPSVACGAGAVPSCGVADRGGGVCYGGGGVRQLQIIQFFCIFCTNGGASPCRSYPNSRPPT